MEFRDPLLPLWAMELMASAFLWVWLFCMGETVGSFLNVVVYRLPRGKNLAYPGSCCPRCGHSIRLSDNIPILSWLSLRGRCRDCGGRISPRYFVVELTVAIVFLLVLVGEHYLPTGAFVGHSRRLLIPHDGALFWCLYVTHVGLVTTLIGAILIFADGFAVPATLFFPILLFGFALPLAWPDIRSIPAFVYADERAWWTGLIDGLAGLATGFIFGSLGSWRWLRLRGYWPKFAPVALSCAVGVVLGWQRTTYGLPVILLLSLFAVGALRMIPKSADDGSEPPPTISPDPVDPSAAIDTGPETPPEELAPSPPPQNIDTP